MVPLDSIEMMVNGICDGHLELGGKMSRGNGATNVCHHGEVGIEWHQRWCSQRVKVSELVDDGQHRAPHQRAQAAKSLQI